MATLVFKSYKFYFLALFCAVIQAPLHVWERPPKLQHHSGPAWLVKQGASLLRGLTQLWQVFPMLHLNPVPVVGGSMLQYCPGDTGGARHGCGCGSGTSSGSGGCRPCVAAQFPALLLSGCLLGWVQDV